MNKIELNATSDKDGVLRLEIAVEQPNQDYRVVITVEAEIKPPVERDANGWPIGVFERVAGQWVGPLERAPQGEYEERDPL